MPSYTRLLASEGAEGALNIYPLDGVILRSIGQCLLRWESKSHPSVDKYTEL